MALGFYFSPKPPMTAAVPITHQIGVDPGQPHVMEVHNVIVRRG